MIYQMNEEVTTKANDFFNKATGEGNPKINKKEIKKFADVLLKYNNLIAEEMKEYKITNWECVFMANDLLIVFHPHAMASTLIDITTKYGKLYVFNTELDGYTETTVLFALTKLKTCMLKGTHKEMMAFCGYTIDDVMRVMEASGSFGCNCPYVKRVDNPVRNIHNCKQWKELYLKEEED